MNAAVGARPGSSAPLAGALVGAALGALALLWAALALLSVEAVTVKALAAVWLAALPVLGLLTSVGYAAGRAVQGRSQGRTR